MIDGQRLSHIHVKVIVTIPIYIDNTLSLVLCLSRDSLTIYSLLYMYVSACYSLYCMSANACLYFVYMYMYS